MGGALGPTLGAASLGLAALAASTCDSMGGKALKLDNWGKRKLAYKIRKQDFAVYVCFDLMVEPAKVAKIENDILLTEEIMRHIIVATTATEPVAEDKKEVKEVEEKEGK